MLRRPRCARARNRCDGTRSVSLAEHPGYAGPLKSASSGRRVQPHVPAVSTPARRYVLRRKPPGQLLASAHAVDREYKVITALGRHTDVPVPGPTRCARTTPSSAPGLRDGSCRRAHFLGSVVSGRAAGAAPRARACPLRRAGKTASGTARRGGAGSTTARRRGYVTRQIARFAKQYQEDTAGGRVPCLDGTA